MKFPIKLYKKFFIKRYDAKEYIKYFTNEDFENLNKKEISFKSAQGNILRGGLYHYGDADGDKLIVFCHGIGCGHRSYMREIEYLCREGYPVISYDCTGCDSSEGDDIRSTAQSLSDLDSCLDFIRSTPDLADRRIFVIGHSWGGFAAGNILNFRDDVEKTVVISGFVSLKQIFGQFLKFDRLTRSIVNYEKEMNPRYAFSSSLDAYNKPETKALIIHSTDDPMIKFEQSAGYLKQNVKNDNVRFIVMNDRKHNPNYTREAVDCLNSTFASFNAAVKKGKLKTAEDKINYFKDTDWYAMTAQDDEVWKEIIAFLKED